MPVVALAWSFVSLGLILSRRVYSIQYIAPKKK